MPATVTMRVLEGPLKGREYSYDRRIILMAGSSSECSIRIPSPASKFLCLIRISPPKIAIEASKDLNHIYINGQNVRRLKDRLTREEEDDLEKNAYELRNGDDLKLADNVFKIETRESGPENELMLKIIKVQQRMVDEDEAAGIKGFEVVRTLAKGGRGTVFLAKKDTGEMLALKILSSSIVSNSRHLDDFKREIRLSKGLRHKNILQLHEGGISNGKYFLAHEYCEGGTVDQLMSSRGEVLGVEEAIRIMIQVLDGIEYLHNFELPMTLLMPDGSRRYRRGLLHRDVSPHNIFLTGHGDSVVAKLGGFDISVPLEISKDEKFGDIAGSICYMTRNIFVHYDSPKKEFDVWAAAATLYNMLTGKFPRAFPEKSADLWQAVLRNPPVPIRDRNPEIPEDLAKVVDEALVEEPNMNLMAAAEFRKRLEEVR